RATIAIAPENNSQSILKKYKVVFDFAIGHSNCYNFSQKHNLETFKRFTHFTMLVRCLIKGKNH
ncbi:hypothetical protein DR104_03640, partial [Mycoplasma hyorhinis]